MELIYLREQKKYLENDLKKALKITDAMVYLKTIAILKEKRALLMNDKGLFSFRFVGIIILHNKVLFCLPKYIRNSNKKVVAKQLLALFHEYSKRENLDKEEIESIGHLNDPTEYNMLSVILFILNDFYENGLYSNEKSVLMFNGEGEINWSQTIEAFNPLIFHGEPIYLEYYTNSTENDEEDYLRHLHKYILNECINKLSDLGLLEFFNLDPIAFNTSEDFLGGPHSIIYRVKKELNIQFVHRKQQLLKAFSSFISKEKMEPDNFSVSLYGTRSFHVVWEKTCGYIMDNKYDIIKELIDKPRWRATNGTVHQDRTLVPDIISMYEHNKKKTFIISDAKYYTIKLTNLQLVGNPGVEDITKQYLYQMAFADYIKFNSFDFVHNAFLFPSEENEIKNIGTVMLGFLKQAGLKDITLIKLPAHVVFEMYLNGEKLDLQKLIKIGLEP